MSSSSNVNAIAGALASVIGYLGAEAAESTIFESMLWPQKFYHDNRIGALIQSCFLMPMGGPIHKAALEVLDKFSKNGLYSGMQRGHMLGTAFFPDTGLRYKLHGKRDPDGDDQVRNGLWVGVLQRLQRYQRDHPTVKASSSSNCRDQEKQQQVVRRTTLRVNHLQLSSVDLKKATQAAMFCEDAVSFAAPLAILASEVWALACAIALLLVEQQSYWFAAYLCMPLVLKFLSIACSVRREPATLTAGASIGPEVLVEIGDCNYGLPLISGPEEVVRQFFRHWGHPVRESRGDRLREVATMILVLVLVLSFPLGLLSMLWTNQTVQVIWFSYQIYLVLAMHVSRLTGYKGSGRLEDCLARELATKGVAQLLSKYGNVVVEARLDSITVSRMKEGHKVVASIIENHARKMSM